MKKAIFLDRDGVINDVYLVKDKPYSPRTFNKFKISNNVYSTLAKIKEKNYLTIIITNQPDISRGLMHINELNKMHNYIFKVLPIDDIYVCIHDDKDFCQCRKPKPGLLFEAAKKWDIDFESSFIVGDSAKDIDAGKAANVKTILFVKSYNKNVIADYYIQNFNDILFII